VKNLLWAYDVHTARVQAACAGQRLFSFLVNAAVWSQFVPHEFHYKICCVRFRHGVLSFVFSKKHNVRVSTIAN